jgi:hypothetical protein
MAFGNGPRIVTDGLVLALDAGDRNSYPGSGTTWRDMSGNGNNSTLTNGPTFSSLNGGAIVYDGIDDYSINTLSAGFTQAMTVITVAKSTNSTWNSIAGLGSARYANGYIIHNNQGDTSTTFYLLDSSGGYTGLNSVTPTNIQNYNFYGLTTDGSTHKIYLNGYETFTTTVSISRTNTGSPQSNYLGLDSTIAGRHTAEQVAIHLIYNRSLTASEILQNYNAQKSRFNL